MVGYTILLFSLPNFATAIGLLQYEAAIVGAMVNLGMAVRKRRRLLEDQSQSTQADNSLSATSILSVYGFMDDSNIE